MVCHCREKLDTEEGPTREEIDFVDIAFPCRARGHIQRGNPFIGIDNRPRPRSSHCNYASNTPLSFFPPLLTRGQVTHYLDIVSFFASYGTKESFSFSGYLE